MKRTRPSARRRMPAFPLLIGVCLLALLCSILLVLAPSETSGEETIPWYLTLVNFSHPLPKSALPRLSPVDENGEQLDSRAAGALQSMLDDMRSQGLSPLVCSSYRPHEQQEKLFQNHLRYPTGKTRLTGVSYEPRHYRYVGNETAQEIMSQCLCLEEYLAQR